MVLCGVPPGPKLGRAGVGAFTPGGKIGSPKEVADAVLWLAGDVSSFVSGEMTAVDGAQTKKTSLPPMLDEEYRAKLVKR
ncbi:MAG: SDR family oxidoreductase [Mesorhizobium sp.]|nr:MAG: SDR family oxidoreductase [Mesorhizobium sp.]